MGFFDLFKKKQNTQPTVSEQPAQTNDSEQRPASADNTSNAQESAQNRQEEQKRQEELNSGLEKTKTGLFSKLARAVAGRSTIDVEVLDDLEEVLITSDVGVETTVKIIERIEARVARDKYMNASELQSILRDEISKLLEESHRSTENFGLDVEEGVPYVIMVVGVNGAGKTTTIGKLAAQLTRIGLKVYIGAADTFRAAAIDQLAVWAERAGATMIRQEMGSDPASVAYDTLKSAVANKADVVLIDTAGRLHNKVGLMNELTKIRNVMGKVIPNAPQEVMLVLDGSTGQNAFEQAKQFTQATKVTSLTITKLDGTAKGGVVIGISDQFRIPVRYIGIGEGIDQLRMFDRKEFVNALFGDSKK
ncbi:MAG TPA: signal recognition particle-docking protein FtsY [Candidatus Alistipes avicola]|uniref:Signal recognition particle receptor FtsY n=1 Tax=Candidatus Alistipes avicola TaxID=2838432 RepID=A0A9D2RHZ5_9BACT|nr:signal recognition particle-docking protein FtsY [uncultured Alistipes sp.]HJA98885.1 signal recognition particle-docking protein FtsY [Candidatus Alistipes avicola]